jgi:hypothetical protein
LRDPGQTGAPWEFEQNGTESIGAVATGAVVLGAVVPAAATEAGVADGTAAAGAGGVSSAEHTPTAKRQTPTASQRI